MQRFDVVLIRGLSVLAGAVSAVVAVAVSGVLSVQERRAIPARVRVSRR